MVRYENILLGTVGGSLSEALVMDKVLHKFGLLRFWEVYDEAGNWVYGIGTGELVNAGIGLLLILIGRSRDKLELSEGGFGWLLAVLASKITDLYHYFGNPYRA